MATVSIDTSDLMKISKLAEATGVNKEAIRFYVKEGLLPKPLKTSRNMAYYDPSCVDKVRLIKELQEKRFLPLDLIRQIISEDGTSFSRDEIEMLLELNGSVFRTVEHLPDFKPLTATQLSNRTGVTIRELKDLEELEIITPARQNGRKVFQGDDVRIVECLSRMKKSGFTEARGFPLSSVILYKQFIERLVRKELKLFSHTVDGKLAGDELAKLVEDGLNHVNDFMSLLRRKTFLRLLDRYRANPVK